MQTSLLCRGKSKKSVCLPDDGAAATDMGWWPGPAGVLWPELPGPGITLTDGLDRPINRAGVISCWECNVWQEPCSALPDPPLPLLPPPAGFLRTFASFSTWYVWSNSSNPSKLSSNKKHNYISIRNIDNHNPFSNNAFHKSYDIVLPGLPPLLVVAFGVVAAVAVALLLPPPPPSAVSSPSCWAPSPIWESLVSSSDVDRCLLSSRVFGWHLSTFSWQSGWTFILHILHRRPCRVCPKTKK